MRSILAASALLLVFAAGCESETKAAHTPVLIHVSSDAASIDDAIARAEPGDVILLSPGTYRQTIHIDRPGITLRGEDRNTVVIDGERQRSDGIVVTADDVTVENLTVREHLLNGVLITGMTDKDGSGLARGSTGYETLDPESTPPVKNYRVRYVTAVRNGLYGIYSFHSSDGLIEKNYASGSADSGIYVGQCKPCRTLVQENTATHNAVGFENANASDDVFVLSNDFSHNRVGLTVSSDYKEALVPQENSIIVGNRITDNNDPKSPAHAEGAFGIGIGLAGATANRIERNLVTGHQTVGMALASSEDLPTEGNTVRDNVFSHNAIDVANASSQRAPARRNCLKDNTNVASTLPEGLTEIGCEGDTAQPSAKLPQNEAPSGIPFFSVPLPTGLDNMTDVRSIRPFSPVRMPDNAQVEAIAIPASGEDR